MAKKKQFEIFAKIAQISLQWQRIQNLRTTFCSFCHGELMAKKWLDSIEKKKEAVFVTDRWRDRQSQRQKIIDS